MDPTKEMIDVTIRIPWSMWARMKSEAEHMGIDPASWFVAQVNRADRLASHMDAEYAAIGRERARIADLTGRTKEIFANWKDLLQEMS